MEFIVRVGVFGVENTTLPCCVARTVLLMAEPNAMYGFKGDVIIALLSAYVEALLYNRVIIVVGIP